VTTVAARPDWPAQDLEHVDRCPACGSPRRAVLHDGLHDRLFGAPGTWTLWRCGACPTAYLDPRPTAETLGRAYSSYFWHQPPEGRDAEATGVARLRRRARDAYLNRTLGYRLEPAPAGLGLALSALPGAGPALRRWVRHLPYAPDARRLLDVGCANGEFMLQMRALGWAVTGIDIDNAALEQARAAGLDVGHGTLESPPGDVAAGGYDAITLNHVLEHVPEPYAALEHAAALLRSGGVLWVATPNLRSLAHRMFGRDWLSLDPPRHLVLLSAESLRTGLKAAGLTRIEQPRPARNLHTVIAPSAALAAGADPQAPPPAPTGLRLRGALADQIAQRRPDLAEELVMFGRRP
jgi:2-polyprenyl-3-methyl-5-hydroxy-6-metoxy-1,4-benzoquinol methylase